MGDDSTHCCSACYTVERERLVYCMIAVITCMIYTVLAETNHAQSMLRVLTLDSDYLDKWVT